MKCHFNYIKSKIILKCKQNNKVSSSFCEEHEEMFETIKSYIGKLDGFVGQFKQLMDKYQEEEKKDPTYNEPLTKIEKGLLQLYNRTVTIANVIMDEVSNVKTKNRDYDRQIKKLKDLFEDTKATMSKGLHKLWEHYAKDLEDSFKFDDEL